MKRFKGDWKIYGRSRGILQGITDPDCYEILKGGTIIAENITSKYDAVLISKAPEMLEMLIEVVDAIRDDMEENHFGADENGVNLIHRIELLINEATET